jgi:hypothetical protein
MKQAQKQAYAKHRSNITNNRFGMKKKNFTKNKKKISFHYQIFLLFYMSKFLKYPLHRLKQFS